MKKSLIFTGIAAVLIGMGFVMPAIALLQETGALPGFEVALLFLGVFLTLGGIAATAFGARRQRT